MTVPAGVPVQIDVATDDGRAGRRRFPVHAGDFVEVQLLPMTAVRVAEEDPGSFSRRLPVESAWLPTPEVMSATNPGFPSLLARRSLSTLVATAIFAAAGLGQTSYHDYSLTNHLGRYIALKSAGYRMISLDVAGDRSDQHYAAVWVKQTGPEFDAIHGASEAELNRWAGTQRALGYREHLITAAGSGSSTVFACVMVKDPRKWAYDPSMTRTVFDSVDLFSRVAGYKLESAAIYGTASAPLYAAVWVENDRKVLWGMSVDDSESEYQTQFDGFVKECWARPAFVTTSANRRYLSVYTDDSVGTWAARHGMTKAAYENELNTLLKLSYEPIQISVAGTGSAARYTAIFAAGSTVYRQVTKTGMQVSGFDHIDKHMVGEFLTHGFMQHTQARAAAVAIAKDGRLVFARGYTYARPGYPITTPTTCFRIASCSKPLTAIAAFQLMSRTSSLNVDSKLHQKVALGNFQDPDVKLITVGHLIDHRSGYNDYWGDDCLDKLARCQASFASQNLSFVPGTDEDYSNGGYMTLGLMIEAHSGQSYQNYIKKELFGPLGVVRPFLLSTSHDPSEARCHITQNFGTARYYGLAIRKSAVLPNNQIVNSAYAISPFAVDASGGWTMSAVDYVRVLSGVFDRCVVQSVIDNPTRDVLEARIEMSGRTGGWDGSTTRTANGRSYKSYRKGGLWHSGHTWAIRRTDGISIAVFCSGPNAVDPGEIDDLVDAVNTWPTHDLFPSYGLRAYRKYVAGRTAVIGKGCPGSNGVPAHSTSGVPEIGEKQSFVLGRGPVSRLSMLMFGFSNQLFGRFRLPWDLSVLGAPGCTLYTSADVSLPLTTNANGSAGTTLVYPNNPALIGGMLFTQFVCVDPGTNPLGLVYSNAVETELGGVR